MSEIPSLGQVAFEAYRAEVQGVAYDGSGIPPWDSLDGDRAKAQRGWEAAAQAIRQHLEMIQAIDVTADDFRGRQGSRWQPIAPGMWQAPIGTDEPIGAFIPAGHGEPPTGETVPVDVEPDCDHPESCDIHGHD